MQLISSKIGEVVNDLRVLKKESVMKDFKLVVNVTAEMLGKYRWRAIELG